MDSVVVPAATAHVGRRTRRHTFRGPSEGVVRWPVSWLSDTRTSYDTDASGYAEKVRGLLDGSPYLRASLVLFAELVRAGGVATPRSEGCPAGHEHITVGLWLIAARRVVTEGSPTALDGVHALPWDEG